MAKAAEQRRQREELRLAIRAEINACKKCTDAGLDEYTNAPCREGHRTVRDLRIPA